MKTRIKQFLLLSALTTAFGLLPAGATGVADLSLTASVAPESVSLGSNLVYALTVSNAGPDAATSVVISNQLPASLGFVSATGFYSLSNGVLLENFASLAAGATGSAQVQVVVQPSAGNKLTNFFQVSANETDPNQANNAVTVVSTVTNGWGPLPGTPTAAWTNNPGGPTVTIPEGGGGGAVTYNSSPLPVTPGAIVLLIDPNGGTNYSNWRAVVNFYSATSYATDFLTNANAGAHYSQLQLFNIAYVPIAATNADGSVTANMEVFGPVGGIPAGQEAIITLTASVQNFAPPSVTFISPTAGQVFGNVQGFGVWAYTQDGNGRTVTGISVQLNGAPVNTINGGYYAEAYPSFYTVDPLTPIPGSNTVSAVIVDDLGNTSTATVTFDYAPATGGTLGIPGTPSTDMGGGGNFYEGSGIGVLPVNYEGNAGMVLAGDVIMLINTNNGTSFSNWKAVVEFFNPADPTGTNGMLATECQTFYQTNASPDYFANFPLMPNVVYTPIATTNANGSLTAILDVYGPAGGVASGQEAIISVTAAIQPDPFALTITSPSTGQHLTNTSFTVTGTTANRVAAVSNVFVQLNGGVWTGATTGNGWTNWSAALTCFPGLNLLQAYAVDIRGNVTATNLVAFEYATDASQVADVSISGWAGPQSGVVGVNLVYFLTVSNAGPSAATGVGVSDQLPAGVTFISATGGVTPVNGLLVLNLGSLAAGMTNQVQITVSPTGVWGDNGFGFANNSLANVVQAFASQTDPDLANNTAIIASSVAGFNTDWTVSSAEYDTTYTTNVSQQMTNYQTELIARLPNGTVVYDQIFNAAYSDPAVQAAVTQAAADLAAAGAVSYAGPAQTGHSQTLVGSSTITFQNTNETAVLAVKKWVGPETLLVDNFGAVQGYNFDSVTTNYSYPTGWNGNPESMTLLTGQMDFNAMTLSLVNTYQMTTNTATYLNSAQYVMTGSVGQADLSLSVSGFFDTDTSSIWYSNLVYSITVSNAGPSTATGVVVSNQISTNVIFVSATGGATPTNGVLLMPLGSLAAGATNAVQIVVRNFTETNNEAIFNLFFTNVFQVFADQADPDPTNNTATIITPLNQITFTASTLTHQTNCTATVNQQATNFSTELIARLPNGTVVYDQTFNAAYSNATVQAAVAQAAAALTNAGASTYAGPTETNASQTLVSSNTVTTTNIIVNVLSDVTSIYMGPQTIMVGDNQSLPLTLLAGEQDYDTLVISDVTNLVTTTNTATYLNSAQYVMTGTAAQADLKLSAHAAPEPVTVGSNLVYTISITNGGPAAASGVVVSNRISASLTFVSATGGARRRAASCW